MIALLWRTIKDRYLLLIIYALASIGLLWMYIALFPAFKDQSASMEQLIKSYPESFMKAFNFDIKSFVTIEGFLSTEQFSFMWPIVTIFMMVGYSGYALSGEVEKGTIEALLSEPISRLKLFLVRYVAGLKMFIIYVVFSILAAIPLCQIYDVQFHSQNFVTMTLLAFLFGLAIYSIAMLCSSIFSDRGKVYFITGGLLVLMYVLNIVASIRESLTDIKYFSFFYYFNPSKALLHNQIDHWAYLVFLGVFAVCTILGMLIFIKRDISV